MTMPWWGWLLLALVLAGASAFCAMLSLSAGTAYGSHYHSLTPRQRVMGRWLYRGAMLAALLCGAGGLWSLVLAARPLWA